MNKFAACVTRMLSTRVPMIAAMAVLLAGTLL